MKEKTGFSSIFSELKSIIKPFESKLDVTADTTVEYCLNTSHIMENKQFLFFAAVRTGKNYVSFYLMPVYVFPDLLKDISPELKKRMQEDPVLILKLLIKNFLRNYRSLQEKVLTGIRKRRWFSTMVISF